MALEIHPAPTGSPAMHGLAAIAIDCHDPRLLAVFYANLLGARWAVDGDGDAGVYGHVVNLDFIRVPEDKVVKNRVHLDFRAHDVEAAVRHAVSLGATLAPDVYDGPAWVVLRDPEGNEICILRPYDGGELHWNPESRRSG